MKIQLWCQVCGVNFSKAPSQIARPGHGKYCSVECKGIGRTQAVVSSRPMLEQPAGYRIVSLAGGEVTKVSIGDYERFSEMNWQVSGTGYVSHRRKVLMHQLIMREIRGDYAPLVPDHINRDKLDNRRQNLRLVTRQQNIWNQSSTRGRKSKYIGVTKYFNKWRAEIGAGGRATYLGLYEDEIDAAYVRDQFAIALRGEFAVLNFDYQ